MRRRSTEVAAAGRALGWLYESSQLWKCATCNFERTTSIKALEKFPTCPNCTGKTDFRHRSDYYVETRDERAKKLGWRLGADGKSFYCFLAGHKRRTTRIDSIEQHPSCSECELNKRVEEGIAQVEAKWLIEHIAPDLPRTTKESTLWACSNDHPRYEFKNNICRLLSFGKPCHECARSRRTKTQITQRAPSIEDYKALEKRTSYTLVGAPEVAQKTTEWRCPKGHMVKVSYSKLKFKGRQCRECAITSIAEANRTEISEYRRIGELLNLKPLFEASPSRSTMKAPWQCILCHHKFKDAYSDLKEVIKGRPGRRSIGCPKCAQLDTVNSITVSNAQRNVFKMLKPFSVYGKRRQNVRLANGKFYPDMIMFGPGGRKLAVAYDSFAYHIERVDKTEQDRLETEYLKSLGYHVLRIRDNGSIPGEQSPLWTGCQKLLIQLCKKALGRKKELIYESPSWTASMTRRARRIARQSIENDTKIDV